MTPISKEEIEKIKETVKKLEEKYGEYHEYEYFAVVNGFNINLTNGNVYVDEQGIEFDAFDGLHIDIDWDKIYSFKIVDASGFRKI